MKINTFKSKSGDAILIEVKGKTILIDGGTPKTYDEVKNKIHEMKDKYNKTKAIDLLILTHYDNDHIGGIIKLLQDNEIKKEINEIWANLEKHINHEAAYSIDEISNDNYDKSANQAVILQNLIDPKIWHEKPIVAGKNKKEIAEGVFIHVIGPTNEILKDLSEDFDAYSVGNDGGKDGYDKSSKEYDSNIEDLLKSKFVEDQNKANKASIVILLEVDEKYYLFPGDCSLSIVMKNIEGKGLFKDQNIDLELLKIPHHGSTHNCSLDALNSITCMNYLLLTNGKSHGHPDKSMLIRILENNKTKKITTNIITNYDSLKKIKNRDSKYFGSELDNYDWFDKMNLEYSTKKG